MVQALASSQLVSQLSGGSQVSPGSSSELPHEGKQSPSVFAVHPGAQQPSPDMQAANSTMHCTVHSDAEPTRLAVAQAGAWHDVGQAPAPSAIAGSHSSPASKTPSPHEPTDTLLVVATLIAVELLAGFDFPLSSIGEPQAATSTTSSAHRWSFIFMRQNLAVSQIDIH